MFKKSIFMFEKLTKWILVNLKIKVIKKTYK